MSRPVLALPRSLVLAVPALLAACDGGAADVALLRDEVSALRSQVKKLESDRDRLASRVEQAERRVGGLQEDLVLARRDAMAAAESASASASSARDAAAPATATEAAAPGQPQVVSPSARALGDLLATEDGRAVFEQAMRTYEARREAERQTRIRDGLVDAFATRANLSPQQTESMRKIVDKALTDIAAVWRPGRDGEATPEQRTAQRQESLAKMEEIRRRTDDEVKGVLDAAQWDQWQQESARLRGAFGGGMGGGPGGFRGR